MEQDQAPAPYKPGIVTTTALEDVTHACREAALSRDLAFMAFTLGQVAQWADTARLTAEAADA